MKDSRAYAGTLTDSDHKLVVSRIDFGRRYVAFKRPKTTKTTFECSLLTCDKEKQREYQKCITSAIAVPCNIDENANTRMINLQACIKQCATKVIGRKQKNRSTTFTNEML